MENRITLMTNMMNIQMKILRKLTTDAQFDKETIMQLLNVCGVQFEAQTFMDEKVLIVKQYPNTIKVRQDLQSPIMVMSFE